MGRVAKFTAVLIIANAALVLQAVASDQVPFRGSMVGLTTSAAFVDPTHLLETVSLAGHATELGNYSGGGTVEVDVISGTTSGSWELTAANGDTLFVSMTGQTSPSLTPGVLLIEEKRAIVGGTGRFANALGQADATGQIDLSTGIALTSWEGTIASTGSDRQ